MEMINVAAERALNYLKTIRFSDAVDICIVAYILFKLIWFFKKENSHALIRGLFFYLIVLWISDICRLTMINFILRKGVEIGALALLVIFQPELRRMLDKIGTKLYSGKSSTSNAMEAAILQTVLACEELSESHTGALIVFERGASLSDIVATGTILNSDVSSSLLENLFYNKAPLHDGAVVIRDSRIAGAGCVLPLSAQTNISKELGTRHRAGIGISEKSDAVAVIVSEETGTISVAVDGILKRHQTGAMLDSLLHQELINDEAEKSKFFPAFLRKLFSGE